MDKRKSYLFSALDFSLSSHAFIKDILFSVSTRAKAMSGISCKTVFLEYKTWKIYCNAKMRLI